MSVFEQGADGSDSVMFSEGIAEMEKTLEESVTIRRYVSQSNNPTEYGQAPQPVYASFAATAVLVDLGVAASHMAAGVLSAGDIHLQIRERLHESDENIGGSHPGDRLIFRGAEYRLIQRPCPIVIGDGVVFYDTYLRRTNSTSDVAGS